jgi:hypothetical protein
MQEMSDPERRQRDLAHERTAMICAKDIMVAYIRAGKLDKLLPDPFSDDARNAITKNLFLFARDIFTPLNEGSVWDITLKWDVPSDSNCADGV